MSLTKITDNLNNISSLADQPSLSSSELKQTFDRAGNTIKNYINNTLTAELDTELSGIKTSVASANSNISAIDTKVDNIVTNGSNTNGKYIKYSDGTLIQYGVIQMTSGSSPVTAGGLTVYSSGLMSFNFPIAFTDTSYNVQLTVNSQNTNIFNFITASTRDLDGFSAMFSSTSASYQRSVYWLAIGRWE